MATLRLILKACLIGSTVLAFGSLALNVYYLDAGPFEPIARCKLWSQHELSAQVNDDILTLHHVYAAADAGEARVSLGGLQFERWLIRVTGIGRHGWKNYQLVTGSTMPWSTPAPYALRGLTTLRIPLWMLPAAFSVAPLLAFVVHRMRSRSHRGEDCCKRCGYNLTGNRSGICPECGVATG